MNSSLVGRSRGGTLWYSFDVDSCVTPPPGDDVRGCERRVYEEHEDEEAYKRSESRVVDR